MILASYNVFTPFTDILQGYGQRVEESHYNWSGCRGKMSRNSANGSASVAPLAYGEQISFQVILNIDVASIILL